MTLAYLVVIWTALAAFIILLALARKFFARNEDDMLHLGEFDTGVVQRQKSLAGLLTCVDRVGKSLTVVLVVFAIAIIGRILYLGWIYSIRPIQ
jgi:flagellar biosynthesis protein FlhB